MRPLVRCLLIALIAMPLLALDMGKALTQYAHRIWGQEEGLFQPTIYSILQTQDGFLWLGTQDSLIRFDGVQFREYEIPGAPVFHDSVIRALLQDKNGNFWIGSVGAGLGRLTSTGKFARFTATNGLPGDTIYCLNEGDSGDVFACTNAGLARYSNGKFHTYTTADGLPTNDIRETCMAGRTRWVAGIDFGLGTWDGSRYHAFSNQILPSTDKATALACSSDGTVWAGTNGGLLQIHGRSVRRWTTDDGLPDDAISSLLVGRDGSVWVGSNDGITRICGQYASVYRTRDGLSHSLVLSLYVDREGTLWAGTKDGLDQFTDGNVTPYTINEGLTSNETGPVLEDNDGRLWVGTLGGGLNVFEGGKFRALTTKNGLPDNTILSLELGRDGDLWVGTKNGLSRLHDGRVVDTYRERDGLPGGQVNAIVEDSQGSVWAGTNSGVAQLLNGHFQRTALAASPGEEEILALARGNTVRLFASTSAPGMFVLRGNTFTPHDLGILRPVDSIFLDHTQNVAWMATLGAGLLRWRHSEVVRVRLRDGLYDNRVYQILDDHRGNFWMASSKGIFRVSRSQLDAFADGKLHSVTSMPFSTGQLRFECRSGVQPAACRTHDGRLWFSTTSGLVMIDPANLNRQSLPPPSKITAVLVNGERMSGSRPLRLHSDQRNVEIRYAGLSFVSPEKVTFRYKLDGFDNDWTEAGSRREAFFTNLPPKHFRFLVAARNANGELSAAPAEIDFSIQPRFYQRVWFFPLIAMLIAAAAVFAYRMRVRHLRVRFDLVLAERSRIARELHDTLLQGISGVTMQLQALWMRMPPSRDRQFLGAIIEDAAACSQEARQSLWGLRTTGAPTKQFSEKLVDTCREMVGKTDIRLELNVQPIGLQSLPETEFQLLRIAREVISNVLSHARASVLRVYLALVRGQLQLTIEDNGIGFNADVQLLDHFGLVGIRERAHEIGAELDLSTAPGAGTRVTVKLLMQGMHSVESNAEPGVQHHTI